MSDNIPFEVQSEIIKRLPVKSVIQCRSVSKLWKSFIDSPKFINDHNQIHHTRSQHHLFVRCKLGYVKKHISVIDNDTFPQKKFHLTAPLCVHLLSSGGSVLGSSNGLICFHGIYRDIGFKTNMVALWNPAIKKSVGIVIPNGYTAIGFGVCPDTSDPKVVKINSIDIPTVHWEVEVYSLSSRVWKSVSKGPAFKSCDLMQDQVTIYGFIYWLAMDNNNLCVELNTKFIISYDLKSDKFGEVCFPDSLVNSDALMVSKVNESLGVLEYHHDNDGEVCGVWVMDDDGVTKSLTKMFTVKVPGKLLYNRVLGFRENGEVMIEMLDDNGEECRIEVYDPSSGRINIIGINGKYGTFSARSYRESLLLLDQTSSIIYRDGVRRYNYQDILGFLNDV